MRATPSDLRVLTPLPLAEPVVMCAACEAKNCTEPATTTDPAGEGVCDFHATHCDCGHTFSASGFCRVCDDCRCGEESTDRETGYVDTCPLHPATAPRPAGDLMTALKAAMGMGK